MGRTLSFVKMHGAGNDFVLLAADELAGEPLTPATVAHLCDRRLGIGADGLLLLAAGDPDVDFRMVYYNADGLPAEMCGNGARCVVAYAHQRGRIGDHCRFATDAGIVTGRRFEDGSVEVSLPAWYDLDLEMTLTDSPFSPHYFCNTGVPHLVIPVDDVDTIDVAGQGRPLRHHPQLGAAGANVNWVDQRGTDGCLRYRTYERGVEAETLACGTGAAAVAVVLAALGRTVSPVDLLTRGGDRLTVTVDFDTNGLRLRGPATFVFTGELTIDE